eukprot:TRINITY_DN555_c0_g1_i1.p1 TRINITY_DN555_c0_g1~~TRINITY_DN555_c0_g1_i1.p1  ORF type:complete len:733 (-),score=134.46 TRINITY_DN555_c0_g1_i1:153-2351(-)
MSQNYMEKLIIEATARFEEKFQHARDGQNINVAGYGGPDRQYNLRTQMQHVPQLQQDKHFMSMVTDVEKYSVPDYALRGDVEKRLRALLCGLLKGLLRECISSSDLAIRKINIEKCWNWYQDKKKQLVAWGMDRRTATGPSAPSPPPDRQAAGGADGKRRGKGNDSAMGAASDDDGKDDSLAHAGTDDETDFSRLSPSKDAPFAPPANAKIAFDMNSVPLKLNSVKDRINTSALQLNFMQQEEEQQRATGIVKKLQLYKKRNLRASMLQRGDGSAPVAPGPVSPSGGSAKDSVREPRIRVVYRDRRVVELRQPPVFMHSATLRPATLPPKGGAEFHESLAAVNRLWVARRAEEAEEKLEEMEFRDTISLWSFNQARIEEEINRRQESAQMSSQTGKTCHKILRRPFTAPLADAAISGASFNLPSEIDLTAAKPGGPHWIQPEPGKIRGDTAINMFGRIPTDLRPANAAAPDPQSRSLSLSLGALNARKSVNFDVRPHTSGPATISLSPYDNISPDDPSRMRMLRPPSRAPLLTPDSEKESDMRLKGLVHTHPDAIRSTSLLNTKLDVTTTTQTIFAPSMLAAIGKMPTTPKADEDENAKPKKPVRTAPKKPPAKAGAGGKPKLTFKKGPVDPNMVDQIFPTLSVEQEVPSLMRMQQMRQVETIREAFAKQGLSVPTSVIEQGILTPEDRPYIECITNLPPPEFGLVRDFTKKREKKPKKKEAASEKKKTAAD